MTGNNLLTHNGRYSTLNITSTKKVLYVILKIRQKRSMKIDYRNYKTRFCYKKQQHTDC